jgi:peptidoglycan/xylan/chitin deacetylase (PgdA/CDA1 family)/protein-tyrosine-phosphatase
LIFEKRGLLAYSGTLAYRVWNQARTARHRLNARAHSRRLTPVSECLRDSSRVWFLGGENSYLTLFAAEYWNNRLDRAAEEAPGAQACSYQAETTSDPMPLSLRKMIGRFGIEAQEHRIATLPEQQVGDSDVFFVLDKEHLQQVARSFPQARNRTFQLGSLAARKTQSLPDLNGLSGDRQLASLRRTTSALDAILDTFLAERREPTQPLRIFMFHAVVPEPLEVPNYCFLEEGLFKQQLDMIERYFRILPLSQAVREMQLGSLTEPTAVITFDDGFHNNYTVAYPELKRRGIPASIFVSTGFIDSDSTPWFCRILSAVSDTTLNSFDWNNRHYRLSGPSQRSRAAASLMAQLKQQPQNTVIAETEAIEIALGMEPDRRIGCESPFRMMSSQAVMEMARSGLVEIGGHTDSHAILSRLSAPEQRTEILSSIDAISDWLGRSCSLFAYPNGQFADFDEHAVDYLREAGVWIALTAAPGENQWYENVMELRREAVGPNDRGWLFENRIRSLIENGRK